MLCEVHVSGRASSTIFRDDVQALTWDEEGALEVSLQDNSIEEDTLTYSHAELLTIRTGHNAPCGTLTVTLDNGKTLNPISLVQGVDAQTLCDNKNDVDELRPDPRNPDMYGVHLNSELPSTVLSDEWVSGGVVTDGKAQFITITEDIVEIQNNFTPDE